jgi:hypothetical protein
LSDDLQAGGADHTARVVPDGSFHDLDADSVLDGGDILPGFATRGADIFAIEEMG